MDDTTEQTSTTDADTGEQVDETSQTETGEPAGDDLDALPEWARKRLTKANAEAGKYRTRLREVEAKLSEATSPEQVETALGELREANARLERDLLVERVARTAQLPQELAELLQGSTEQELVAHAAKLAKFVTPTTQPVGELRGGLDPSDTDDFDPVKAAHAARRTRY